MSYLKVIPYENTVIQFSNLEPVYFFLLCEVELSELKWNHRILGGRQFQFREPGHWVGCVCFLALLSFNRSFHSLKSPARALFESLGQGSRVLSKAVPATSSSWYSSFLAFAGSLWLSNDVLILFAHYNLKRALPQNNSKRSSPNLFYMQNTLGFRNMSTMFIPMFENPEVPRN